MESHLIRGLVVVCCTVQSTAGLALGLSSCSPAASTHTIAPPKANSARESTQMSDKQGTAVPSNPAPLWFGSFAQPNWQRIWQLKSQGRWGFKNIEVMADPSHKFAKVLRVRYPAQSASPIVMRQAGTPLGGAQFYATLGMAPQTALRLSYSVRFAKNFNFVKGGKLPGLFGGSVNNGGHIPDGVNGFSTRFMWRRQGDGEVYAYLPTSKEHGTSLGRGSWRFQPGRWYRLEQEVILNHPGQSDGQIRVWIDGQETLKQTGLLFRTQDALKIEGIFFSTFFGGNDPSWATPKDAYADFADFAVTSVRL